MLFDLAFQMKCKYFKVEYSNLIDMLFKLYNQNGKAG